MSITFTDDYEIWDNAEAVTLITVTSAGDTNVSVSSALRLPLTTSEMASSNGVYTKQDCHWLLPGALLTAAQSPRPRWRIQAANEFGDTVDWTILERSYSTLTDTFDCLCRDLVLYADLRDTITVVRPTNNATASGMRNPEYNQYVYTDIAAKIQEVESEVSEAHAKQGFKKRYVCFVAQDLTVTLDDRVISDGTVYQIVGYRSEQTIDSLFEMDLEIMPGAG